MENASTVNTMIMTNLTNNIEVEKVTNVCHSYYWNNILLHN